MADTVSNINSHKPSDFTDPEVETDAHFVRICDEIIEGLRRNKLKKCLWFKDERDPYSLSTTEIYSRIVELEIDKPLSLYAASKALEVVHEVMTIHRYNPESVFGLLPVDLILSKATEAIEIHAGGGFYRRCQEIADHNEKRATA
jgi:hypothetical protein